MTEERIIAALTNNADAADARGDRRNAAIYRKQIAELEGDVLESAIQSAIIASICPVSWS